MSLGTRRVYRGLPAFLRSVPATSTPQEPLLFLYPRWTRTVATEARPADENHDAPHIALHVDALSHRLTPAASQSLFPVAGRIEDSRCLKGPPLESNPQKEDESEVLSTSEERSRGDSKPEGCLGPFKYGYFRKIEENLKARKARKDRAQRTAKAYQDTRRSERDGTLPNWRRILQELEFFTPTPSRDLRGGALRILVPKAAVSDLLFGLNYNIWEIKKTTGCHIKMPTADEDDYYRAILLSGSVQSISRAAGAILRLAPGSLSEKSAWKPRTTVFDTSQPLNLGSDEQTVARHVRAEQRQYLTKPRRADTVKKPAEWTMASFGQYVYSLTGMKVSPHLQQLIYRPNETHTDTVIRVLKHLFFDPQTKDAISVTALNDAMSYAMRIGQVKLARQLFVRVEMLKLPMNTETFNIMLRGCAKSRDLGTFHFILHMMIDRGHTPDAATWVALVQTVGILQIKQHVADRMKIMQLLQEPGIQKQVCEQFITEDIQQSLDNGQELNEFLINMAERYSEDWLNVGSASRILNILSNNGLVSRCWDFVQFMDSRGIAPTAICYNAILSPCRALGNADGAFEILSLMSTLWPRPSFHSSTYNILFDLAWKNRLYNVTRVLWQYACLEATTTFQMRHRINTAIRYSKTASEDALTSSEENISAETNGNQNTPTSLWNDKISQFAFELPPSSNLATSDEESRSHRKQMRGKLEHCLNWVPTRPLPEVLQEAFAVDKEYKIRYKELRDSFSGDTENFQSEELERKHRELLTLFDEKTVRIQLRHIRRRIPMQHKKTDNSKLCET